MMTENRTEIWKKLSRIDALLGDVIEATAKNCDNIQHLRDELKEYYSIAIERQQELQLRVVQLEASSADWKASRNWAWGILSSVLVALIIALLTGRVQISP